MTAMAFHQRPMRVAVHNHISIICFDQRCWSRNAEFVAVTHVDADASDLEVEGPFEQRIGGIIAVADDGMNRRDERQFVHNFVAADIAGVKDQADAVERPVYVGAQQAVRIADKTDEAWRHDRVTELCLVRRPPPADVVRDARVIQHAGDHKVQQLPDLSRAVIEPRGRRKHHRARAR